MTLRLLLAILFMGWSFAASASPCPDSCCTTISACSTCCVQVAPPVSADLQVPARTAPRRVAFTPAPPTGLPVVLAPRPLLPPRQGSVLRGRADWRGPPQVSTV